MTVVLGCLLVKYSRRTTRNLKALALRDGERNAEHCCRSESRIKLLGVAAQTGDYSHEYSSSSVISALIIKACQWAVGSGCPKGQAIVAGLRDVPEVFIGSFVFVGCLATLLRKVPFEFPELFDGVRGRALEGHTVALLSASRSTGGSCGTRLSALSCMGPSWTVVIGVRRGNILRRGRYSRWEGVWDASVVVFLMTWGPRCSSGWWSGAGCWCGGWGSWSGWGRLGCWGSSCSSCRPCCCCSSRPGCCCGCRSGSSGCGPSCCWAMGRAIVDPFAPEIS